MIDVIEELLHITTPEVSMTVLPEKLLRAINGTMHSLVLPTGPRIVDEDLVVDTLQIVVQESVDEAISQGGNGNVTTLVIAHRKDIVRTVAIGTAENFSVQCDDVILDVVTKTIHLLRALLTDLESEVTLPES